MHSYVGGSTGVNCIAGYVRANLAGSIVNINTGSYVGGMPNQ